MGFETVNGEGATVWKNRPVLSIAQIRRNYWKKKIKDDMDKLFFSVPQPSVLIDKYDSYWKQRRQQ